jgi:hypothetical protein
MVYDEQTSSVLGTDRRAGGPDSNNTSVTANADGSYAAWFRTDVAYRPWAQLDPDQAGEVSAGASGPDGSSRAMHREVTMSRPGKLLVVAVVLVSTAAWADDVTGSDRILCTAIQATRCSMDEDCRTAPPWNWNIPQFIEIDFTEKRLATTAASGQNRATPFKNLEREDGIIYLQGVEGGRAFSFVIAESTGSLSVAVATEGGTTSVLGACTPR